MGAEIRGVPEAAPLTGAERTADSSIGLYLARQRRLRGISLDDLAELTKIPRRSLERLEAGAFDRSPDGFARGFVRTVAVALGLDPEEAVMRFLGEPPVADEEMGAWRTRWLVAGVAVTLAVVAVAGTLWVWRLPVSIFEAAKERPEIIYRRDAVRALAEVQAGQSKPQEWEEKKPEAR